MRGLLCGRQTFSGGTKTRTRGDQQPVSSTPANDHRAEAKALTLGTTGNVLGAVAALVFYLRSGSDALLLDGLYTAVMAGASVIASQVGRAALQPRSRAYPFGASGQEPLYVLFRTLVLLGIVAFAVTSAAGKLLSYVQGAVIAPVQLDGLGWYFAGMVLLNLWLWQVFQRSWNQGQQQSDLLSGMAVSARIDALISAGTGVGLLGAPLLMGTPLEAIVPIADSLLVLLIALALLPEPIAIVMGSVAEAAGSSKSVGEEQLAQCRSAMEPLFHAKHCTLIELAMLKLGRTYTVVAYVEPQEPTSAAEVDGLRLLLEQTMQATLQSAVLAEVIPTATHPYAGAQS